MPKIDLHIAPNIYTWKITETEQELLSLVNLDAVEQEHVKQHIRETRRKELLASRILVQTQFPQAHIHYYKKRPVLINSEHEISISNSKNIVAIQIQEPKIKTGIDIQFIADTVLRVKKKYLHQNEFASFNTNNIEVLNIIWSVKEALYKAFSEDKLEFKKQIICETITPKLVKGVIIYPQKELTFKVGVNLTKNLVTTWYIP